MKRSTALLALLVLGCGGGVEKSDVVGSWSGGASMTYEAMQNDAAGTSEQANFLAEQEGQGKKLALELREDGSATFTYNQAVEGGWSLDGGTLTLTLPQRTSADGGPAFSGTYAFALESKTEMEAKDPNVEGYTVTFRR